MIKSLLEDEQNTGPEGGSHLRKQSRSNDVGLHLFDDQSEGRDEPFVISEAAPESFAETARRSGLAWSAGVAFFAAVVFMMIIGWGADLLLGSAPWGLIAGIILGSLIGFIQFFRLTSQIFKK